MTYVQRVAMALAAAVCTWASSVASAQTPAEFFKGKTVSLLVGFGPGGEDDLWARAVSRHLTSHIRGNPNVIPVHMPGSGGLLVVNRLYNTAAKDGTAIGMINRGIPFEPLLGGQGTQFDALKINYIGSPGRDTTVCAARKDAPVQAMQDLYSNELTVGGTGSGADTAIYPDFLSALLGMKFKLVTGYQGICLAYDSLSRGTLARNGQINVLLQAALTPDPRIKDVPSVLESAHSPDERQALELFFARAAMGRPFVAPPEVPADRITAFRQAFAAMLRDPAFLDEAKKQNLNVVPISSQEMTAVVDHAYKSSPAIVKRTMQALGRAS
jgi:tripartite-type tricarboxylate transporter receptor subunit TctC